MTLSEMRNAALGASLTGLAGFTPIEAHAGAMFMLEVGIENEETGEIEVQRGQLLVDKNKLWIANALAHNVVIFDHTTDEVTFVRHHRKDYQVVPTSLIDNVIHEGMSLVAAILSSDREKKEIYEADHFDDRSKAELIAILDEHGGLLEALPTQERRQVGGIECSVSAYRFDGDVIAKVCMADAAALDFAADDQQTIDAFLAVTRDYLQYFPFPEVVGVELPKTGLPKSSGFPMEIIDPTSPDTPLWRVTEFEPVELYEYESIPTGFTEVPCGDEVADKDRAADAPVLCPML